MNRVLLHIRLAGSLLLVVLGLAGNIPPDITAAQGGNGPAYPLKVSPNGRYLVDQQGNPFFYVADTAWPLFAQLDKAETERYLEDRRQKGFNTIQVSLLPWNIDSPNREGHRPFLNNNLATPNEAYFQHVDWVIETAAAKGLQLVIGTAWFGHTGQNYRSHLNRSNARSYGAWLGQRYHKFDNLIWFHGGDDAPGDRIDPVRDLAAGIDAVDRRHLMTYHGPAGRSSSTWFFADDWLDFNMAQTYYKGAPSSYQLMLADYSQSPTKPSLNAEPNYENLEGTTPYHVRQAAYWSALSGAFGVAYGADPVWNIGVTPAWQAALDLPGTQQIGHLQRLLTTRGWHRLVPDQDHSVVTEGYGRFGESDYVSTARADDGSLVLAYLPISRPVTVNLAKLQVLSVMAHWFDPADGRYIPATQSPLPNTGSKQFTPPAANAAGDRDWVLVLESAEAQPQAASQPGCGTGLLGIYYNRADFTEPVIARTDATLNFDWGAGAPVPAMDADSFTVRWTGQVQPLYSEAYTFATSVDDGVRLWVAGKLLIDGWTSRSLNERSATVSLAAGEKYDITVEYVEQAQRAVARLWWSSPSQAKQIIPQCQLFQPQEIYLSQLPWTAASSGLGPVERDMSAGGAAGADGKQLTLNGRSFARGLGVHANSEIRYALNGAFTRFSANIGVDDEVGDQGSVVFQVWADGEKLYDSGVLRGSSIPRQVHADVSGKQELRLIVTDGGDSNNSDHADWADARIVR